MENLVVYPILLQFITSIVMLFFWKNVKFQKVLSVSVSVAALALSIYLFYRVYTGGFLVLHAGKWKAPFGISFIADTLSVTMTLLSAISGLAVSIFSVTTISQSRLRFGFLPVMHFLLTGLNGVFLTGDIFNMYVWFEIIVITSFVLLSLGGEKAQLEGSTKYFTLNIISSTFFLTGLGVLYGITGTLNIADLHQKMAEVPHKGMIEVTSILFLIGFGTKAAMFPFFYWLPSSYHTPPSAVSALFGGLLTKMGVYALLRAFTIIFPYNQFINDIILGISLFTMIIGGMGALVQGNIVRIFSYLIICHIGFMLLGLSIHTEQGLNGSVSYMIHDIVIKTNLFLIAGVIYKISGTHNIKKLGGLYKTHPILSLAMFLCFISLVGVPPFSGFWPKISLVRAASSVGGAYGIILICGIIFASFITLLVVAKIWMEVFWKDKVELPQVENFRYFESLSSYERLKMCTPIVFLLCVSLFIGFGAEYIQLLSSKVTQEILTNTQYIQKIFE